MALIRTLELSSDILQTTLRRLGTRQGMFDLGDAQKCPVYRAGKEKAQSSKGYEHSQAKRKGFESYAQLAAGGQREVDVCRRHNGRHCTQRYARDMIAIDMKFPAGMSGLTKHDRAGQLSICLKHDLARRVGNQTQSGFFHQRLQVRWPPCLRGMRTF